jgi:hypothetical protein
MRPQEGADVTHRQGDLVLGGLSWVEADLRVGRETDGLHGYSVRVPRDVLRQDQYRRLAVGRCRRTDRMPLLADRVRKLARLTHSPGIRRESSVSRSGTTVAAIILTAGDVRKPQPPPLPDSSLRRVSDAAANSAPRLWRQPRPRRVGIGIAFGDGSRWARGCAPVRPTVSAGSPPPISFAYLLDGVPRRRASGRDRGVGPPGTDRHLLLRDRGGAAISP